VRQKRKPIFQKQLTGKICFKIDFLESLLVLNYTGRDGWGGGGRRQKKVEKTSRQGLGGRRPRDLAQECRELIILPLLFCRLLGNGGEERVAAEEGDYPDHHEVFHCLKHVQLEPEVQVQREYGAQARVETLKKEGNIFNFWTYC
jgi:hypothetical protein